MMALKSSPYLIVTCTIIILVTSLSIWSHGARGSTPSKWRLSNKPLSPLAHQSNNNYNSAVGRKKIDTTSEIGRTSNASLGVCDPSFLRISIVIHFLIL